MFPSSDILEGMKRGGPLERRTPLRSKTRLRVFGHSDTADIKERIQALLRAIVIARDGGCLLRNSPETGACGGYRKDGELIKQAEHLHTRASSSSFADTRLVICLCQRHHIFYKAQYPDDYYRIVRQLIGPERSALLTRVQEDRSPHRYFLSDWRMMEIVLQRELTALQT